MGKKIVWLITLIMMFSVPAFAAITVNITAPATDGLFFNTTLPLLNATTNVNANCSYNFDNGENTSLAGNASTVHLASLVDLSALSEGNHSINVICYNATNVSDLGSDQRNITLDLSPPNSTVFNPPAAWETGPFTAVYFNATDNLSGVNYTERRWKLEGSAWSIWLQSNNINLNNDGNFTVEYRSVDNVGNVESAHNLTIQRDQVNPVSNTTVPAAWQNSSFNVTIYAFDLNATNGTSITTSSVSYINYTIDGGSLTKVSADNVTIQISTDGNHTIAFYAVDIAGNVESSETVYAPLDLGGPNTTATYPSGWQTSPFNVVLNATDRNGSGIAYINYSLNGGSFTQVAGNNATIPITLSRNHTIIFYAVDNLGQVESNNTVYALLDQVDPSTTDDSPADWRSSSFDVNLSIVANHQDQNNTVSSVFWTGSAWQSFTANSTNLKRVGVRIAGSVAAGTTLYIRDGEGGSGTILAQKDDILFTANSWNYVTLDSVVNLTIGSKYTIQLIGLNSWYRSDSDAYSGGRNSVSASDDFVFRTFTEDISGINRTTYRVDAGAWTNGTTVAITTNGNHTIEYYSVDNAGNVESTNTIYAALDTNSPNTTITGSVNVWNNTAFNLTVGSIDGAIGNVSRVNQTYYRIDGGNWTNSSGGQELSVEFTTEGNYTLEVYSTDNAGNVENFTNYTALLDLTYPTVNITSPTNTTYVASQVNLTFPVSDALSGLMMCNYSLDKATNVTVTCNASSTVSSITDGSHTIEVFVYDNAGNMNTTSISFTTANPPTYASVSELSNSVYLLNGNYTFNITWTDTDGIDSARLNLDGTIYNMTHIGSNVYQSSVLNLSVGSYSYSFVANDTAGNSNQTSTYSFTVYDNDTTTYIDSAIYTIPLNVSRVVLRPSTTVNQIIVNSSRTETDEIILDLSNVINSTGEFNITDDLTFTRNGSTSNYSVFISGNTTVTGGTSWDGNFTVPTVTSGITVTDGSVDLAVDVGTGIELTFSAMVKIVLSGMAGKSAGWTRGSVLTPITSACDNITNPTLTSGECYGDDGDDLVIWTFHFTTFGAYTPTTTTTTTTDTGSNSGAYNLGIGVLNLIKNQVRSQSLKAGNTMMFKTLGQEHSLTLDKINAENNEITVTIESMPQIITMSESITHLIDTDDNGWGDLEVWFELIRDTRAIIYLKAVDETEKVGIEPVKIIEPPEEEIKLPEVTEEEEVIEEVVVEEAKGFPWGNVFIGLGIAIVIAVIVIALKKRNE